MSTLTCNLIPFNPHCSHQTQCNSTIQTLKILAPQNPNFTPSIHATIIKSPTKPNDTFPFNALLDAYFKCGLQTDALNLFDQMPHRDVVSWTTLISGLLKTGSPYDAIRVFETMVSSEIELVPRPNEFTIAAVLKACAEGRDVEFGRVLHGNVVTNGLYLDSFVRNCLVGMYSSCGELTNCERLVVSGDSDVVGWTTLVSGCVEDGLDERALMLFLQMLEFEHVPNEVTMLSVIRACSSMRDHGLFGWIHAWVVKLGLFDNDFVLNSLMEMYLNNGCIHEGADIFCHLHLRKENTRPKSEIMMALIHACTSSGSFGLGKSIHGYLIKHMLIPCTLVENSLMDMYGKNGETSSAYRLFKQAETRDIVSWNTMISCFAKVDQATEALQLVSELQKDPHQLKPDFVTLLNALHACAEVSSLPQGQILHGYALKAGLNQDTFVENTLIDMYAKSGSINFASRVFENMGTKDLGSWNSMIAAYGMHGEGISALQVFNDLKLSDRFPNGITFLNLLSACSHSGLDTTARECFRSLVNDYKIESRMEHYSCMVDLLCRAGRLPEAMEFINTMPVAPEPMVWRALLGACSFSGNVEVAELAYKMLGDCDDWGVALSNAYSMAEKWEMAAEVRREMRKGSKRKEEGWSSVELGKGGSVLFMVADTRHPQSKMIYEVLEGMKKQMVGDYYEKMNSDTLVLECV